MVFELIAVIVAGFAGAGIALLLNMLSGKRLPRWSTPVAAGVAMIAVTISNEYGWFNRQVATLPDGLQVVQTVEDRAFYRPWTYAYPFVNRFLAVDTASLRRNEALPGQRLVDVYAFGRWAQPTKLSVAVDCEALARAEIVEGVSLGADGRLQGANWREVGAGDPVVGATCAIGG